MDPYHGQQDKRPEAEAMDLPEDLNLDQDDEGENDGEGEGEKCHSRHFPYVHGIYMSYTVIHFDHPRYKLKVH